MKTTIEINDALLQRAKQLAVEHNVSLKAIFEAALRGYLNEATQRLDPRSSCASARLAVGGCSPGWMRMTGRPSGR